MRKILFVTSTHGNEQAGTEVLQQLEKEYPKAEYGYNWIIGNERAYELNQRFTEQDLNRSAPGDSESDIYEVRRAAEIIQLANEFDIAIDLHGTKTDCGVVTIIPYPTAQNLSLAASIGLKRNVVWYSESSIAAGPLVQHMSIPAIEFECGPKSDPAAKELLYQAVRDVLIKNKRGLLSSAPTDDAEFYTVYGKQPGSYDPSLSDFSQTTIDKESFYPFLSGNEYSDITCYKMRKVNRDQIPLM